MAQLQQTITSVLDKAGLERDGRARTWLNREFARRFGPTQREVAKPFTSFSQFGEDAFLHHLLTGKQGTYVDVGSGHPIQGSNTYALYEQGWSGILIDPLAANVELAKQERPRDTIIQSCCGAEIGETKLFTFSTSVYSTTQESRIEVLGEPETVLTSPVITLASLGLAASPEDNVFLTIDVEGDEHAVLDGNDWDRFTPGLVAIEEWDGPLGKPTPLLVRMNALGYSLIGVLGYSSIYRHAKWRSE